MYRLSSSYGVAILTALLAVPTAAQPADPAPSETEIAPGIVLRVDWGLGRTAGCPGSDVSGADGPYILQKAVVTVDGRATTLDTGCIGGEGWVVEPFTAGAFRASRPLPGLVEVTRDFDLDASGTTSVTWLIGPLGAMRTEEEGQRGEAGTRVAEALEAEREAREQETRALAASLAADRAADEARERADQEAAVARRAAESVRDRLARHGAALAAIGADVPTLAQPAPLAIVECAVETTADGNGAIEPGDEVALVVRTATPAPVVAWVDFGDGASELATSPDGSLRVAHAFERPGTYRVAVEARASSGEDTCGLVVTVGGGEPAQCAEFNELNTIYFDPEGAGLDADAEERIAENADLVLAPCPSLCVTVVVDAGEVETGPADLPLRRAAAVREAYLARGIAPSRVRVEARDVAPYCVVPDDLRCRRVESLLRPCAGE